MQRVQTQGVHHITLVGANRQTSVDFWEGLLGMPLVFEQPNLDDPEQNHLYFDPGDGRLITIFTSETWKPDRSPNPTNVGNVHHLAFAVSRVLMNAAAAPLRNSAGGIHGIGSRTTIRAFALCATSGQFQVPRPWRKFSAIRASIGARCLPT